MMSRSFTSFSTGIVAVILFCAAGVFSGQGLAAPANPPGLAGATGTAFTTVYAWGANDTTKPRLAPALMESLVDATAVACGSAHCLALKSDRTVWAWGDNDHGQLGDGTTKTRLVPVRVRGIENVVAVAGGLGFSTALKSDGTVWAWGNNRFGHLGFGTNGDQYLPVQVRALETVVAIANGKSHCLALKSDGTVWAWGDNDHGQLGDGTPMDRRIPVQVQGLSDVIAVAGGSDHSLALKSDGTVWAWGDNVFGQLGDGTTTGSSLPLRVGGLSDIGAIAAGGAHTLALKSDGTVWAWGANYYGQLGTGDRETRLTPVEISELPNVVTISAGMEHSAIARSDGTVWTWGRNTFGQLGDGTTTDNSTPRRVVDLHGVIALACGYARTVALRSAPPYVARIVRPGSGNGSVTSAPPGIACGADCVWPFPVGAAVTLTASPAEDSYFAGWGGACQGTGPCTVLMDGDRDITATFVPRITVWAWGYNASGQLGDGTTTTRFAPVEVQGLRGVIGVAGGGSHSLALKSDGTVWGWGSNCYGEVGDGTTTTRFAPVEVQGLSDVIAVAGGGDHSLALKSDGTVWAWGDNAFGQLGDGTTTDRHTPVQAPELNNVVAVAAGARYSLALKSDGTVWGWGWNDYGQLGDGTKTSRGTPMPVIHLDNVVAIAGGDHSLALKSDGTVWGWGNNWNGQLGDGSGGVVVRSPVQAAGVKDMVAIAGRDENTVALKSDGTVWGWGSNRYGELGDGSTAKRSLNPVQARGLTDVIAIEGGISPLALKSDGTVWTWGVVWANDTTYYRHIPGRVAGADPAVAIASGGDYFFVLKSDGKAPFYTLKIRRLGPGKGVVASSPEALLCDEDSACAGDFETGTSVVLTAIPDPNNTFVRWSGEGCSGAGTCRVTMDRARNVLAIFADLPPCTYTLSPVSRIFPAGASALTVTVTAKGQTVCSPPGVTEDYDWIAVSPSTNWKKNRGTVKLSLTGNASRYSRSGTVLIGRSVFAVTQAGVVCTFKGLTPSGRSFAKEGGTDTFSVAVSAQDCRWSTFSGAPWLRVAPNDTTGNGTITYSVDPNPTSSARTSKASMILMQTGKRAYFTIDQAGK